MCRRAVKQKSNQTKSPVHRIEENVCLNIVQIQKKCEIREKQDILVIIWCYLMRVNKCIIQFYASLLAEQSLSSFLKKDLERKIVFVS